MTNNYDSIIIGSGAAALTTAVTAAHFGLKVLLVEKNSRFGGTSARSGGVAWLPNNPHMARLNITDSREQTMQYFRSVVGEGRMRPEMMEAFYDNSRAMVEFLEEFTEVKFEPTTYPDYNSELPGAMVGRSISTCAYEGRRLGPWFELLEPPMKEMCLLGGMMVDAQDVYHLMNLTRSFKSLRHASTRFANYLLDRMEYSRGTRLTIGNALIARLLKSAIDAGVTLWRNAPAKRLIWENGQVAGVVIDRNGQEVSVRAARGVVLATGGFAHDEALKQKFLPKAVLNETLCVDGASGDGIRMALSFGAQLGGETWQSFLGNQVYKMFDSNGHVSEQVVFTRRDRNKPGFVLVNRHGRRFANEAAPYNDLTWVMTQSEDTAPSYLICDHIRLRRYGLGLLRPGPAWLRPLKKYLESGHIVRANSVRELASKLSMDPDQLESTVRGNNEFAKTGKDTEFGKGDSSFDRWQGDPSVKPNPNLGPIESAPFYAVQVWPSNLGTFLGILTDERARVLNLKKQPVIGLYACGCDMHHMLTGSYAGGGSVLGPGMTFGFIAGKEMAQALVAAEPLSDGSNG